MNERYYKRTINRLWLLLMLLLAIEGYLTYHVCNLIIERRVDRQHLVESQQVIEDQQRVIETYKRIEETRANGG